MDFYSVLGKSPKGLNDNILFNPFEENFYIPAMALEIGYHQGADLKVVGYEIHNCVIVRVIYPYKPHVIRIEFTRLISGDTNPGVFYDAGLCIGDFHLPDCHELHVLFRTGYPECL